MRAFISCIAWRSSTHTHTHTPMLLSFAREEALPCKHIASSKSSSDGVKGNCWHTRLLCCTTGGHTAIGYFFVSFFYFSVIFFSRVSCWRRKWQPTPVFLPGESQGRGSLVGCHLWGHTRAPAPVPLAPLRLPATAGYGPDAPAPSIFMGRGIGAFFR